MMSDSLKFIIKIFLFLLLVYVLALLFPTSLGIVDVSAKSSPVSFTGYQTTGLLSSGNNVNANLDFGWGNKAGANMGNGYLVIGFSYTQSGIDAPVASLSTLRVKSGAEQYNCYFSSYSNDLASSSGNSSSSSSSISAICPVFLGPEGLSGMILGFTGRSTGWELQYRMPNLFTFVPDSNDEVVTAIDKQAEEVKKTNETLKDSSIDDNININDNSLTDESGIQDLLLMPLTLMNAVNTGFNSSCSSFSLGSLYGHDLSLKCFTISDVVGSDLSGIIDVIISGIFIYLFSKHLRKVFDRTTNLENEEGDVI